MLIIASVRSKLLIEMTDEWQVQREFRLLRGVLLCWLKTFYSNSEGVTINEKVFTWSASQLVLSLTASRCCGTLELLRTFSNSAGSP